MESRKSTMALASFAATLDPATLPDNVRQKLGWLLLDFLRVCSMGARLPWSEWSKHASPKSYRVAYRKMSVPRSSRYREISINSIRAGLGRC
jgi:hypothetical protein